MPQDISEGPESIAVSGLFLLPPAVVTSFGARSSTGPSHMAAPPSPQALTLVNNKSPVSISAQGALPVIFANLHLDLVYV
jgi:hypothetical protein